MFDFVLVWRVLVFEFGVCLALCFDWRFLVFEFGVFLALCLDVRVFRV